MSWNTDNAIDGLLIVLLILAVVGLAGLSGVVVFALPWYGRIVLFSIFGALSLGFIIGGLRK